MPVAMQSNTDFYKEKLKQRLDELDAHDTETRRLLNDPDTTWTPELGLSRRNLREDLVANVLVAARTLVQVTP